MANLAELVVALTADASKYKEGLNTAQSQLKDFQKYVTGAVGDIAAAFGVVLTVDKLIEFTEQTIEAAAALEHLSQETGASVEALSQLQGAAKISGIDDLGLSLARLSKAQGEVATGNEKVAGVFQALGISIADVDNLKPDQLLLRVADGFAKYADGAQKSAAAQILFGRGGQQLIPYLDQGAAGIEALRAQVDALGGTTSQAFAAASAEFEGDLARLKIASEGLGQQLVAELIPALDDSAKALTTFIAGIKDTGTGDALDNLGKILKVITSGVISLGYAFSTVFSDVQNLLHGSEIELETYASALAALPSKGIAGFNAAIKAGQDQLKALDDKYHADELARDTAFLNAQANLFDQAGKDRAAARQKNQQEQAAEFLTFNAPQAQLQLPDTTAINSIKNQIDSLNQEASKLNLSDGLVQTKTASVEADLAVGKLHDDFVKAGAGADQFRQQVLDAAAAVDKAQSVVSLKGQIAGLNEQAKKLDISGGLEPTNVQALAAAESIGKLHDQLKLAGDQSAIFKGQLLAANQSLDEAQAAASVKSLTDKIQEQIDTFQKGKVDVDQYTLTHGKLGAQLAETKDKGDAARASVLALDVELQRKVNAQSITDINVQLDQLNGKLVAAATAAFDLQHTQEANNFKATGDTQGQADLDKLRSATLAQAAFNEQLQKEQDINDQLAAQISATEALKDAGYLNDTQAATVEQDQRKAAIDQLTAINVQLQSIADNSGLPALKTQALAAATATNQLATQTDLLAKNLKNDTINSAVDDLTAFADHSKSAGQAFGDFVTSVADDLLKLALKSEFESLFSPSGSGTGGGLGGIFTSIAGALGGARASGGPVTAGKAYLVGENGPEPFVPSTNGTIIPNGALSGGMTVHQTFVLPQGFQGSKATQQQVGASAARGLRVADARNN